MVGQAPSSLESLKLTLIRNFSPSAADPLLTVDGIRYLLKALAYADGSFTAEIENVLVKAGALAIPELVKSLTAENLNVRSTAAMALIRIGRPAEEALLKGYTRYSRKPNHRWVFEFVLQELGLEIPAIASPVKNSVVSLEKVG